jgi:putative acetyltransferase
MPATGRPLKLDIAIQREHFEDIPAIRFVNEQAFGQPQEADIIDALRQSCDDLLSLVALHQGQVVGHILFSPATISHGKDGMHGMGLAPLAVLPAYQRQGIGSKLVETGLEILSERSTPFVIVLGHAKYYPRFGFERASRHGILCQWQGVPDEAFMILVNDIEAFQGVQGVAYYRAEFDAAVTNE